MTIRGLQQQQQKQKQQQQQQKQRQAQQCECETLSSCQVQPVEYMQQHWLHAKLTHKTKPHMHIMHDV